jgi:predicted ester cyclase
MSAPFALPKRAPVTQIRGGAPAIGGECRRTQSLAGFEDEFTDVVHYITRITDEIWADRDIGRIYDTYAEECVIYSGLGTVRGVEEVVAGTIMGINGAPDGQTSHINVAWTGDDSQGFYTSHLGFGSSTNVGETMFGPPSGKKIERFFVADCISKDNKIHTEWLMRDNGAMVRQMGLDMQEVARRLADGPAPAEAPWRPNRESKPLRRRYEGVCDTPQHWAEHHFQDVWNMRLLTHVGFHYAPNAKLHWCGGFSATGINEIQSLILSLLASLPDSYCHVDHVCWSEEEDGVILAVRWMLEGTTRPGGLLGAVPSGKPIAILGASHFRFDAATNLVIEEWTVFDEVAALIAAYRA